jgi:hypothetical protein
VIENISFVVFLWAMVGLCAWNLLGAFRNGVVYVRSTDYSAKKSKGWFRFAVLANIPLTVLLFFLATLMTLSLFGLV